MKNIVLHHYWGSPFAEKIRLIMGYKGISWKSVELPPVPPRPELGKILGPFRRTPIMQIGADFFCDTALMARVLDQLHPSNPLDIPSGWAISALVGGWAESRVFVMTGPVRFLARADVQGIFNGAVDARAFSEDRLKMLNIPSERFFALSETAFDHVCAYLDIFEELLFDGRKYISGNKPCFADFSVCHLLWWLRQQPVKQEILETYPLLSSWMDRIASFGHGTYSSLSSGEALNMVSEAQGTAFWMPEWQHRRDSRMGRTVSIMPDDYAQSSISGKMVASSVRHLSIEYQVEELGTIRAHFPRTGYEVTVG